MKATRKRGVIGAFAGPLSSSGKAVAGGGGHAPGDPCSFGRILVPTDFSDPSRKAFKCAARMAEQFGSRVTLIHVIEPVMSPDFTHFPLALDEEKVLENARNRLLGLAKACFKDGCIERTVVRPGNPFHEIAEAAREFRIDLIVIATHGYTGIKRALLGSTAERVIRHAPCAVMTVR